MGLILDIRLDDRLLSLLGDSDRRIRFCASLSEKLTQYYNITSRHGNALLLLGFCDYASSVLFGRQSILQTVSQYIS